MAESKTAARKGVRKKVECIECHRSDFIEQGFEIGLRGPVCKNVNNCAIRAR